MQRVWNVDNKSVKNTAGYFVSNIILNTQPVALPTLVLKKIQM